MQAQNARTLWLHKAGQMYEAEYFGLQPRQVFLFTSKNVLGGYKLDETSEMFVLVTQSYQKFQSWSLNFLPKDILA